MPSLSDAAPSASRVPSARVEMTFTGAERCQSALIWGIGSDSQILAVSWTAEQGSVKVAPRICERGPADGQFHLRSAKAGRLASFVLNVSGGGVLL